MFDIGFIELLICGVIALIVLGPERLPTAARAAGRWVGAARRMVSQFSSELDSQLKAEELRKELREAGDVGLDDVRKSVRGALDEAKKYEHMVMPDGNKSKQPPAPATRQIRETGPGTTEKSGDAAIQEQYEADEDPAAANNSGHSSMDRSEDTTESQNRSPDKRT